MPMKPREMEKLILADGWVFKYLGGVSYVIYVSSLFL